MVSAWSVIDHCCNHRLIHQGDTVLLPSAASVRAALNYGARDTLDCTLVVSILHALRMRATALLDA